MKEPDKEISLLYQAGFVKNFCYLGGKLNASSGSEAAVTRTRIKWKKVGVASSKKVFVNDKRKNTSVL